MDCAVRGRDFRRDLEAIAKTGYLAAGVKLWYEMVEVVDEGRG